MAPHDGEQDSEQVNRNVRFLRITRPPTQKFFPMPRSETVKASCVQSKIKWASGSEIAIDLEIKIYAIESLFLGGSVVLITSSKKSRRVSLESEPLEKR